MFRFLHHFYTRPICCNSGIGNTKIWPSIPRFMMVLEPIVKWSMLRELDHSWRLVSLYTVWMYYYIVDWNVDCKISNNFPSLTAELCSVAKYCFVNLSWLMTFRILGLESKDEIKDRFILGYGVGKQGVLLGLSVRSDKMGVTDEDETRRNDVDKKSRAELNRKPWYSSNAIRDVREIPTTFSCPKRDFPLTLQRCKSIIPRISTEQVYLEEVKDHNERQRVLHTNLLFTEKTNLISSLKHAWHGHNYSNRIAPRDPWGQST